MITNHFSTSTDSTLSTTARMQSIRKHFKDSANHHEFYIANALNTVNLDQSFASFQRLDQLFTAFKKQVGSLDIQHDAETSQLNTLMLLASHLGQFLAERSTYAEQWLSREELKRTLSESEMSLPQSYLYDYALVLAHKIVFPLLVVHQYFQQSEIPLNFSQHVEIELLNHMILTGESRQKIAEEMHALQKMYQNQYPLPSGSPYLKLVEISNLDYSLKSLERLDELMREMRQNYIISAENFLTEENNYYFILFLSGYLGRVIAQHAGTSLRWLNPAQASQMLGQDIQAQLPTARIAHIHNRVFFTTGHVCDFLFAPIIQTSSTKYAQQIINDILKTRNPMYIAKTSLDDLHKGSPYHDALHQAGVLIAYIFQFIHGVMPRTDPDDNMIPTSFPPGHTFIKHMGGPDEALNQLEQNPNKHPFNVLAYEMYACLPHIRTDAFAIHIRQYGAHAMNLQLIIPYFSVFDYRGFSIFQPYLNACDAITDSAMPQILSAMQALFDGINSFETSLPAERKVWANHYQPQLNPYPQGFAQN